MTRYDDQQTMVTLDFIDAYVEEQSQDFADAIAQQPEPPCLLCKNFDLCSTQLLACKAFFGYIGQPSDKTTYRDWETMDRLPTSKIYLKCFKHED